MSPPPLHWRCSDHMAVLQWLQAAAKVYTETQSTPLMPQAKVKVDIKSR